MAYFAPYIDETGFHYPTYQDIVDDDGILKSSNNNDLFGGVRPALWVRLK